MLEYIGLFRALSLRMIDPHGSKFLKVKYAELFHGCCLPLSSQNPFEVKRTRIGFVVLL